MKCTYCKNDTARPTEPTHTDCVIEHQRRLEDLECVVCGDAPAMKLEEKHAVRCVDCFFAGSWDYAGYGA